MSEPLVSICIPAYARPVELREAILSVTSQSVRDLELLVGDDSGDLAEVVASVGDSRVVHVRNEPRLGMAQNWNALLDRARGRYVGLLMDDDRLLPGFLEETVARLDRDPRVGVAFTNHHFDRDGSLRDRRCALRDGRHDDFLAEYIRHMPVAVSAALMRREVWAGVRPLPDLLTADVVLHARAAAAGWAFDYVDRPLMAYRVHAAQQSTHEDRFRDDGVRAWESFAADGEAERLRRERLARALVGRAATALKRGRLGAARGDLARARDLAGLGARGRALALLADHPSLVGPCRALWSRRWTWLAARP
jgi:glycosyltransferase involved in cell wall biosynthesis